MSKVKFGGFTIGPNGCNGRRFRVEIMLKLFQFLSLKLPIIT